MSKKIVFVVASTLFLVTALICVPLTFAQLSWGYCKVDVYGTNLNDYSDSTTNTERFQINVAAPPSGSEITNTIEVRDTNRGEEYNETLSVGDIVYVNYQNANPIQNTQNPASESGYFIISYEGEVSSVTINAIDIPEFSPILIVPMFIAATLLAFAYRRKRTSQIKQ